jgi:hypothetical protein
LLVIVVPPRRGQFPFAIGRCSGARGLSDKTPTPR